MPPPICRRLKSITRYVRSSCNTGCACRPMTRVHGGWGMRLCLYPFVGVWKALPVMLEARVT